MLLDHCYACRVFVFYVSVSRNVFRKDTFWPTDIFAHPGLIPWWIWLEDINTCKGLWCKGLWLHYPKWLQTTGIKQRIRKYYGWQIYIKTFDDEYPVTLESIKTQNFDNTGAYRWHSWIKYNLSGGRHITFWQSLHVFSGSRQINYISNVSPIGFGMIYNIVWNTIILFPFAHGLA